MPQLQSLSRRAVLTLLAALLAAALAWALWPRPAEAPPGPRLVLLGLDGLDWAFLDERVARGDLPNFARLRREGLSGPLESLRPLLSPIIWTTVATGVGPDRHGVLDFLETGADGRALPITSRSRREKAFWELAWDWDRSVGVVNWFGSWPAEEVPGWLVSDRVSYHSFFYADPRKIETALTWPPALMDELRPLVVDQAALPEADVAAYFDDWPGLQALAREDASVARQLEQFRHLLAASRTYQAAALRLMDEQPTDLTAVYLDSYDTAGHLFASYVPPASPRTDARKLRHFAPTVDRVVQDLDRLVGQFLQRLKPGDRLLVISDHGFRTGRDRPSGGSHIEETMAADWHRPQGLAVLWGSDVTAGSLGGMSVLDVLPAVCALLQVPPLTGFEGKVPEPIARLAPPLPAGQGTGPRRAAEGVPETDDSAAAEVEERLEALGYIGSGDEGTGPERYRAHYYNNLGVYLHKTKKDYPRAEQEFLRARQIDPADPLVQTNLASLYLAQKRFDEALPLLREVVGRQPQLLNARINLAICLRVVGLLDEARAELERSLAQDPAYQPAWWNLGLTEEKAGRPAEAAAAYRKASELTDDPAELAETANSAGLMWVQAGRMDEARAAFERGAQVAPEAPDPKLNLANVHALEGRAAEARRLFEEVLARDPAEVKAMNGLGQLALRDGDMARARELLSRSLRLQPGQERVRALLERLQDASAARPTP